MARPRPLTPTDRRLLAGSMISLTAVVLVAHWLVWDRSNLPDIEPFLRFQPPSTGEVFDQNGERLIEVAHQYRRVVSYPEIPPVVVDALLSAEDRDFFHHPGIDPHAIPRVFWKAMVHSSAATTRSCREGDCRLRIVFTQGGSTLTQQLVRGYFLPELHAQEDGRRLVRDNRLTRVVSRLIGPVATNKLVRKREEIRISLWLEEEMTRRFGSRQRAKEEILARYASFIYVGNGRYGFAAGSEYYFDRPLGSIGPADADQAALLAGITKWPVEYAPAPDRLDRPRARRDLVLRQMADAGYLDEAASRRFQARPLAIAPRPATRTDAPAAVQAVFAELRATGDERVSPDALLDGRIVVRSTVDNRVQRVVNAALEEGLAAYEARHPEAKGVVQGSVVVLRNADGGILAEAGGRQVYRDHRASFTDWNRAADALRQPGSAMKPVVYLTALRQGVVEDLDSTVLDAPISVGMGNGRAPKEISNYDHLFKGDIPLRVALAESRNTVAIRLAEEVGVEPMLATARDLGIRTPLQPYVTTALGASEVRLVELADAYRALASGLVAEPHTVDSVQDAEGDPLWTGPRNVRPLAIEPQRLAMLQEGLRGVVRLPTGTAHALDEGLPVQVMGKTGTTSGFRDALFVGSSYGPAGITVAVRVGFDDNRTLGDRETGGRVALPIFRRIVQDVYASRLAGPPPAFPETVDQDIDSFAANWEDPLAAQETSPVD